MLQLGQSQTASYSYKFNMNKKSSKVVASYLCSNRPVNCDQCKGVYWSYNFDAHFSLAHKSIQFKSLISNEEKIHMLKN